MTNVTTTVTKESRVLAALQADSKGLTAAQMTSRFGVANPTATITNLRQKGFAIYANRLTNKGGETRTFYRLGTPSRSVVAAGYRAIAAARSYGFTA
jgi:predicted ArsR family transcriptional regulator